MKKSTPDVTEIVVESSSEKIGSVTETWQQENDDAQYVPSATPQQAQQEGNQPIEISTIVFSIIIR